MGCYSLAKIAGVTAGLLLPSTTSSVLAQPVAFITDSTPGFYNDQIGTSLDRTNPFQGNFLFPGPDIAPSRTPSTISSLQCS
jgi:hypothetical protein